ncbi:MAG: META domain-containing protein [Chloroflexi bacterium]|nr:META domain-containing protein [Chloroflexota bacterium]
MRFTRSRAIGSLAALALAVAATPVAAQSSTSSLADTSWAVTAVATVPSSGATLVFTDGVAGGFAGCNNFRASYEATDGSLTVGPIATTMKACDEAVMAFEQSVLAALGSSTGYTLDGSTLVLTDAAGAETIAFEAQSPASLEGTWEVTGYLTGSGETAAVVSPIVDSQPVITFGPDGIVSGTAGCNQFSGGFGIEGSDITIGPLMSTMMACADDLMAQEAGVMLALEGAATWSISGTTATLLNDEGTIQVTLSNLTPTAFGG